MTERPILFSAPMVRALLEGRKTQTRRVVRFDRASGYIVGRGGRPRWHRDDPDARKGCPYGAPGDKLWVRETWAGVSKHEDPAPLTECVIEYRADLPPGSTDYPGQWPADLAQGDEDAPKWRPSIHMRREHSRILLEITEVRVQRVQEISEQDALAEGAPAWTGAQQSYRTGFYHLWDSINAKRGYAWEANPWVWALTFRVLP